jgi:hypothetical protein
MSIEHGPARQRHAAGGIRYGRIPAAVERSGLSRGSLYILAREHRGLFKKRGKATTVDLMMLDDIIAEFPAAEIGGEAT